MARTTRATRQQRDVDGTEVSPLVSLDDHPKRQKAAPKKKAKEDSSKSSKKVVPTESVEETTTKVKKTSKKAAREEQTEEVPSKAKQTSKRVPQNDPTENAASTLKEASKEAQQEDAMEEAPVKVIQTSKKMQQEEATEKASSKTKQTIKRAHQETTAEEASSRANKSPKKAQRVEPVEEEPAGAKANRTQAKKGESNDKPTKSTRAASPIKAAPADSRTADTAAPKKQSKSTAATSPAKTTSARAKSPAKSIPAKQTPSPDQQKSAPAEHHILSTTLEIFPSALISSPSPFSPSPEQIIKTEPSPDHTPCPTNGSLPHEESIGLHSLDPILRNATGASTYSDCYWPDIRSPPLALGSPTFVSEQPSMWRKRPASFRSRPFLDKKQVGLVSNGEDSPDSLPKVETKTLSATMTRRIGSNQRPKFILTTPEGEDASLSSSPMSQEAPPLVSDGNKVPGTFSLEHKDEDSQEAPSLVSDGTKVPGAFPLEHKDEDSRQSSVRWSARPGRQGHAVRKQHHAKREPLRYPAVHQNNSSKDSGTPPASDSLSEEQPGPVKIGRIQQLNRDAKVYVQMWMAPNTFATPRERELQGTYCIPKSAFLNFFLALRPEQKVLTDVEPPSKEHEAKAPAVHESPEKGSSKDSTPAKRKLELPPPNDERPSPSKRLRTEPKPRKPQTRSPAKTNGVRVATKSPVKPKRYAKEGGYDKNGNLVLPGQELLDSATEEEFTKAQTEASPLSPLAVIKPTSGVANSGPLSPTRSHRPTRHALGPKLPPKFARDPNEFWGYHPIQDLVAPTTPIQDKQPSVPPATAPNLKSPGHRWNLAGRVTKSIGKLNPFSFFTRSTQPLAEQPPPVPAFEPMAETAGSPSELTSAPDILEAQTAAPHTQRALTVANGPDTKAEIPSLLLSVLQLRCPDIADERLVSTVQASFTQSESIARHKAEEAQHQLESITDPDTKRLLVLLEQQYPDLSPTGILGKLEDLIAQQRIVAKFKEEQSQKHQQDVAEVEQVKKRKRPTSPEVIPNPVGKSYGMDLDFFGSSSGSEAESDQDEEQLERPSKKPRLEKQPTPPRLIYPRRHLGPEPVKSGSRKVPDSVKLKEDSKRATPYTGSIFKDSGEAPDNIFTSPKASGASTADKSAGHFEVPLTSSSSDESEGELPATPSKQSGTIQNKATPAGGSILKGSPLNTAAKAAKEAAVNEASTKDSPAKDAPTKATPPQEATKDSRATPSPPPAPTPAHAALPPAPASASQGQHDPVALARAQANKYAPKTSSKLKSVSRLSNSSPGGKSLGVGSDETKGNLSLKLTGLHEFDWNPEVSKVFESWERISPVDLASFELDPAVTDALAACEPSFLGNPLDGYELDTSTATFLDTIQFD